jgi:hypothetical protein
MFFVCIYLCQYVRFQLLKQSIDFHETWYGPSATRPYTTILPLQFLQSEITTRICVTGATIAPLDLRSQNGKWNRSSKNIRPFADTTVSVKHKHGGQTNISFSFEFDCDNK